VLSAKIFLGRYRYRGIPLKLLSRAEANLSRFHLTLFLAGLLAAGLARAQMMLPGALQAQPEGPLSVSPNTSGGVSKTPKPAGLKEPAVQSILGRELAQNGSNGILSFRAAAEDAIEIVKLSLAGESMSDPGEPCLVDVAAAGLLKTRFDGRPGGLLRYAVEFPGCPFSFDVLEGAVLVSRGPSPCEFKEAECRVDPGGLWGPPGNSFGPDQAKQFERERGRAEADVRANFRALLSTTATDNETAKKTVAEQAGFSSAREMTCRAYLKEDSHGFCALRLTQARAFALHAAYGERTKAKAESSPAGAAGKHAIAKRKLSVSPSVDTSAGPNPQGGALPQPAPN
jgi:hypothetical protein